MHRHQRGEQDIPDYWRPRLITRTHEHAPALLCAGYDQNLLWKTPGQLATPVFMEGDREFSLCKRLPETSAKTSMVLSSTVVYQPLL